MVARSNREYQTLANVDGEEDPLVATHDDIPDIPLKGTYYDISPCHS